MPTTTRAHALFVKLRCFGLKCPQNEGSARSRELSLPLDPYATATDWISPLSFRNFRANPAALRFAAGRDMLQNCSTVAPKVQSFACAWGVNRSRQFAPRPYFSSLGRFTFKKFGNKAKLHWRRFVRATFCPGDVLVTTEP